MRTIRQCIRHIIKVNFIVIREKWHIYLIMGTEIVIIQNNMEFSYSGPAIYSKEELPQELKNIDRYASYQYGDYSLSKNLEKIDLEDCSRAEAADYCNAIMEQYGYAVSHLLTYIQ